MSVLNTLFSIFPSVYMWLIIAVFTILCVGLGTLVILNLITVKRLSNSKRKMLQKLIDRYEEERGLEGVDRNSEVRE